MNLIDQDIEEIFVENLVIAGFEKSEAIDILRESETLGLSDEALADFQKHFRDEDGGVDLPKIDAFMHIQNVRMTVDSYDMILDERAEESDKNELQKRLEKTIRYMHELGYSAQDIAQVCNDIKISKSATPHPTESLSPEGVDMVRRLVKASESSKKNRQEAVKDIIKEMARAQGKFGAYRRSNMVDEIDNSIEVARIHNDGVNALDADIEHAIYQVTGEVVDIHTNTALRSWDYDADGKNNAEGFTMMMKMAASTMAALEDVKKELEEVLENDDLSGSVLGKVRDLRDDLNKVLARLEPINRRTREIIKELAACEPTQRATKYIAFYEEEYHRLYEGISSIYDEVDDRRGYVFYQHTLDELNYIERALRREGSDLYDGINNAFCTLRRCGFAVDKGQTRHNDLVYIRMIDNLFESDAFWGMKILDAEDREEIMRAGKFSNLSNERQYECWKKIVEYAEQNGNRDDVIRVLRAANPLTFKPMSEGGNGYPEQERTYIDRMALRALYPLKFEEGIISDAQEIASPRQKFLADLFGMAHMKHMSLNEDMDTLARQHRLTTNFNAMGGAETMEARAKKMPELFRRKHETLHVMRPASDAEKNGGSFTRLQALEQYRMIVREAYDMRVPIEIMIGGGQSLNRFGGDVGMVRRIVAQELKGIFRDKKERGEALDDYDREMMTMATSILYTEQGRTKRYMGATPLQVADDYTDKLIEILEDYMDLNGDVNDYSFIDKDQPLPDGVFEWQRHVVDEAIEYYNSFAYLKVVNRNGSVGNDRVLDRFVQDAGCPNLVPYQNNGARPAAGKAKSAKNVTGLRAIGKDQSLYAMQIFHAGFFATGLVMKRLHNTVMRGSIDVNDAKEIFDHPDWHETIFSRNLIDAGRFNPEHLFAKLNSDDEKKWTFDRAVKIGKEIAWKRDVDTGATHMVYAGAEHVSQEELYLCKVLYDHLLFVGITEAALRNDKEGPTLDSDIDDILNAMRPQDNSLNVDLGPKTQEKWPLVMDALETHDRNAPAYALYYVIEEDIVRRTNDGQSDEAVKTFFGDGDPKKADQRFRQYGSALRAGTLPHKSKWMGIDTYGIKNRTRLRQYDYVVSHRAAPDQHIEPRS